MTAGEQLTRALLDLADLGQSVPCQGRRRDRWTSEDPDERAWAASVCVSLACPVLEVCGEAGATEKANVWGGVDRTPTNRKRGAA